MPTSDTLIAWSPVALVFLTFALVVTTICYAVAAEKLTKVSKDQLTLDRYKVFRELFELDLRVRQEDVSLSPTTKSMHTRLKADIGTSIDIIIGDRLVMSWKDLLQSMPTAEHQAEIDAIRVELPPEPPWAKLRRFRDFLMGPN